MQELLLWARYDSLYFETCNLTCILCCLTLCIGDICGNGDNSFCYLIAEICFCICLELLKNHCRDFLRSILFVVDSYLVIGAHLSFD